MQQLLRDEARENFLRVLAVACWHRLMAKSNCSRARPCEGLIGYLCAAKETQNPRGCSPTQA